MKYVNLIMVMVVMVHTMWGKDVLWKKYTSVHECVSDAKKIKSSRAHWVRCEVDYE